MKGCAARAAWAALQMWLAEYSQKSRNVTAWFFFFSSLIPFLLPSTTCNHSSEDCKLHELHTYTNKIKLNFKKPRDEGWQWVWTAAPRALYSPTKQGAGCSKIPLWKITLLHNKNKDKMKPLVISWYLTDSLSRSSSRLVNSCFSAHNLLAQGGGCRSGDRGTTDNWHLTLPRSSLFSFMKKKRNDGWPRWPPTQG